MIIVQENKMPRPEDVKSTLWDITWKDALKVFKMLSGRTDVEFFEPCANHHYPLGNQPITGFKISGDDLYIYGKQVGYIIFGRYVKRVTREHFESAGFEVERMTMLFNNPQKTLMFKWAI
jgi:hypothetical protein